MPDKVVELVKVTDKQNATLYLDVYVRPSVVGGCQIISEPFRIHFWLQVCIGFCAAQRTHSHT